MSVTTIIREDSELLAAANKIFGGLVKKAWAVSWDSIEVPRSKEEINDDFRDCFGLLPDGSITDFDIVLEFTSDARVHFSVSEWGHISKTDTILEER